MSRRSALVASAIVIVVAAAVLLAPLAVREYEKRRVKRAVTAYDLALAESIRTFDETELEGTALPREIGRVRSYLLLLQATGTSIDAQLLELEVREVESSDTTVTALVYERWSELERDPETGLAKGQQAERAQVLRYTLAAEDGVLKVYLSEVVSEEGVQ